MSDTNERDRLARVYGDSHRSMGNRTRRVDLEGHFLAGWYAGMETAARLVCDACRSGSQQVNTWHPEVLGEDGASVRCDAWKIWRALRDDAVGAPKT